MVRRHAAEGEDYASGCGVAHSSLQLDYAPKATEREAGQVHDDVRGGARRSLEDAA
jgi:hypothetical protein